MVKIKSRLDNYSDEELIEIGNMYSDLRDILEPEEIDPFLKRVGHLLKKKEDEVVDIYIDPDEAE